MANYAECLECGDRSESSQSLDDVHAWASQHTDAPKHKGDAFVRIVIHEGD